MHAEMPIEEKSQPFSTQSCFRRECTGTELIVKEACLGQTNHAHDPPEVRNVLKKTSSQEDKEEEVEGGLS